MNSDFKCWQVLQFLWLRQEPLQVLAQYPSYDPFLLFKILDSLFNALQLSIDLFVRAVLHYDLLYLCEFNLQASQFTTELSQFLLSALDQLWDVCDAYVFSDLLQLSQTLLRLLILPF
jgi:hypothetical protein